MVISVKRGYIRRSGWSAFAAALLLSAGCAIFHTDQYYRDLIYDDPDDYLAINSEINQEDIPFFERVVSLNPGLLNQDAGADGSLLDYALTHHRLKIAQWFLDHGANPNKFNGFGENPLRLLALCPDAPESRALYASLFARGANPNLLDEWGASALGFCLKRGPTWPIPILLANGADPWAHGKDGVTQVHYAAFVGRLDLVKEFVGTKTLAEIRAITPQSFVVAAAGSGDTAVLQYFLDLGDDINAQALPLEWDSLRYQCSALHQAVQMLKPGMVNYLIQHKADPDAKDGKGETPLFLAAREGRTNCAVALIEGGANPQIEDQGELPVKCAIDYSHPETATAMEAAIAKRAQK